MLLLLSNSAAKLKYIHGPCKNVFSPSKQVLVIISRINKPPYRQPLGSLLVFPSKQNFIIVNKLQTSLGCLGSGGAWIVEVLIGEVPP